jgi:putative glutamine amidotransferase
MPVGTYIACSEPVDPGAGRALVPSRLGGVRHQLRARLLPHHRRPPHALRRPRQLQHRHAGQPGREHAPAHGRTFPQLAGKVEYAWGGFVDISMNRAPDFGRLRRQRVLPARLLGPRPGAHRPGRAPGGRGHGRATPRASTSSPAEAPALPRRPLLRTPAWCWAWPGTGCAICSRLTMDDEPTVHEPAPAARLPVVLVPACNRMLGDHPFHIAGRKYVDAVRLAGALPLVVPRAEADEIDGLLDLADGVLLTGSPSNVHPSPLRRGRCTTPPAAGPGARRWTLPLIPRCWRAACRCWPSAAARRKPTWRSAARCTRRCRRPGLTTTAPMATPPAEVQYGPSHPVHGAPGGLLAKIVGRASFEVNSVHGQGVNRLADGPARGSPRARRPGRGLLGEARPASTCACSGTPSGRPPTTRCRCRCFKAFGQAVRNYRDRVRGSLARLKPCEPDPARRRAPRLHATDTQQVSHHAP